MSSDSTTRRPTRSATGAMGGPTVEVTWDCSASCATQFRVAHLLQKLHVGVSKVGGAPAVNIHGPGMGVNTIPNVWCPPFVPPLGSEWNSFFFAQTCGGQVGCFKHAMPEAEKGWKAPLFQWHDQFRHLWQTSEWCLPGNAGMTCNDPL